jgi:hypothetical protein
MNQVTAPFVTAGLRDHSLSPGNTVQGKRSIRAVSITHENPWEVVRTPSALTGRINPPNARRTAAVVGSNHYTRLISIGLHPGDRHTLNALCLDKRKLSHTPYRGIIPKMMDAAGIWGQAMLELLALAVRLETDESVATQALAINWHPRPRQLSTFIDNQRTFHADIFIDMDLDAYLMQMWAWWKALQPAERQITLIMDPDTPNALASDHDWSALCVRGPAGFSLIVIGLMIGRMEIDALPEQQCMFVRLVQWCKLVLDVKAVAELMVSALSSPDMAAEELIPRKKMRTRR